MMHCARREMWMCIVQEGRFAHENIIQLEGKEPKVGRLKGLEFGPPFT
jgi:hypothetical protein